MGVYSQQKHLPLQNQSKGWFYCTKNSKMGFCPRRSLSLSKSCISIFYILSLPIFSSYSVFPSCEVRCRVTVERHRNLAEFLNISTKVLNYGASRCYPSHSPTCLPRKKMAQVTTKFLGKADQPEWCSCSFFS